ncbi:hypothetical protein N0V94_000470 [Neodidymelliopsis sp. IMI 364377]|nr:hypothetical protein N0V94_000470 [Neodidymelliopsis sp. IMI 364377]
MPPKRKLCGPLESTIKNAHIRSNFGDAHTTRETALMASRIATLRSHDLIDDIMATELSKPITDRSYTPVYLRTHPDYTGQQPPMLSMITAQRHQMARDKELERFVEDYEAGKIDQWGNLVAQHTTVSAVE